MREIRDDALDIETKLKQARDLLDGVVEQFAGVAARLQERATLSTADLTGTLEAIEHLTLEQDRTLEEVRARGQGPGLARTVDQAAALDREQIELVGQLKEGLHSDGERRQAVERYRVLERQQQQILMNEIGKFEAQGMRNLLDQVRALGEQQEALLGQLALRL